MGQGNTSGTGTYFYAKPINMKKDEPEFPKIQLTQKKDGGYAIVNTPSYLTGYITDLQKVDEMHPTYGRMRGFKFVLYDPDDKESYIFDLKYSSPSRELLNRMASLEDFTEKVKISFYRGDSGYAGASLRKLTVNGEEKVERKYGYKEEFEKRIKTVHLNGTDHKDYTELDHFFDQLIERKLSGYAKPQFDQSTYIPDIPPPTPDTTPETNTSAEPTGNWDNDLPF